VVKKHSEHKGPAPPPPPPPPLLASVVESISNEEPQKLPIVLKIEESNIEKETQFVAEPEEELEIQKSMGNECSEINDSINNNSEIEKQPFDVDENTSVSIQSIQLRKHDVLNPRPISVAASINGPNINSMEDSQIRTRRRSSSASNRNQRRPSPPSLDKVLQMNQNIEKNKGNMPNAVMNELTGRFKNNQDETDQLPDKDNSNKFI